MPTPLLDLPECMRAPAIPAKARELYLRLTKIVATEFDCFLFRRSDGLVAGIPIRLNPLPEADKVRPH